MTECKHFNRGETYPNPDNANVCNMMQCSDCKKILYSDKHKWNMTSTSIGDLKKMFEPITFDLLKDSLELICQRCAIRAKIKVKITKPVLIKRDCS